MTPARRTLGAALLLASLSATGAACAAEPEPTAPTSAVAPFDLDEDFPDPDVVPAEEGYAAFATGGPGLNIRVATSPDLATWTVQRRDALPRLPAWASPGRTWAPDVSRWADGYLMYFTAEDTASGRQCIGAASAPDLSDDFTPAADTPLVCPVDEGGAIDPSTFEDADGSRYLLWKTDGNCCGLPTWIELAPLSDDGLSLAGEPRRLLTQDQAWEGALVEAPVLVERDGRYVLFYSANDYASDRYAVGVATAESLRGPYRKQEDPVVSTQSSGGAFLGPGGQDVVSTPDGDVLVFHSWDEQYIYRGLHVRPLIESGGRFSVTG